MAANQSAAASSLGGSLGQAAALRQNDQNQAGYQAQGQQQIAATQAQAQSQAAQQYAQQVAAMRASNQQGMQTAGQNAAAYGQNANNQASFDQQQRGLSDQASLFGQNLANQQKASNYDQQENETNMALDASHAAQQQKNAENQSMWQRIGAGAGAAVSVAGHLGMMLSDVRAKEPVSLGYAAHRSMMR